MLLPSKPFTVVFDDLRLRFEPDHEAGGYSVSAVNRKGVHSQGDTFEEALAMILDAAHFMAECDREDAAKARKPAKRPAVKTAARRKRVRATRRAPAMAGA